MQIKRLKKMLAMTLAELLVCLTILGTVTILTVPALKNGADKAKIESLFRKGYYDINYAIDYALSDDINTPLSKWTYSQDYVAGKLQQYLNYTNYYGKSTRGSANCLARSYTGMETGTSYSFNDKYCFNLADGISVELQSCNKDNANCTIVMDLNGPSAPNVFGYDAFAFTLDVNGLSGYVSTGDWKWSTRIMENDWKINYW